MGISAITNSGSTTDATKTSTTKAGEKSALDKEAFLKLLVAQLSHQDPLQPTEGTEFVAQLSQFAMVEQSIAQSAKLDAISAQMGGLSSSEATGLIGKDVTLRSQNGISFDGLSATGASVNLAGPAAKVTVQIQDASGNTLRTLDLGAKGAGNVPISWDGRDDAGQPVPKGSYKVKVDAQTADGKTVNASQDVSGKVTKVSFEKGYPEVLLDSGVTAPISDLVSVGGIVR
jgi:flagellar basal-body rod modification protein FlgD